MSAPFFIGLLGAAGHHILGPVGTAANRLGNRIAPIEQVPIESAVVSFVRGDINVESLKSIARDWGFNAITLTEETAKVLRPGLDGRPTAYNPLALGRHKPFETLVRNAVDNLTNDEIVTAFNRNYISWNTTHHLLQRNNVYDFHVREILIGLGEEIPGPSDLIHFAVRHAFSQQIVEQYNYNDELPLNILPYMKAQGLGGEIGVTRPAGIDADLKPYPEGKATWFDLYWWSHWQIPAVTQGYEMLQRLYVNSRFGPSPEWSRDTEFDSDDLKLLLRTQDIPRYWRDRLEAISYLPLQKRDIQRLMNYDVLDGRQAYHAYRAQGYNETNALHLLNLAFKLKEEFVNKRDTVLSTGHILKYYNIGVLTREKALEYLKLIAHSEEQAEKVLSHADIERDFTAQEKIIETLHKAALTGLVSEDDLFHLLQQYGIPPDNIQRMVTLWAFEKRWSHRDNSVQEIIKAFKTGIITDREVTARLFNLNYTPRETTLIVNTAIRELENEQQKQLSKEEMLQVKEQKAQDKETRKEQKAIESAREKQLKAVNTALRKKAAEQDKNNKQHIRHLLAPYTDANIKHMVKSKILGKVQVKRILVARGWVTKDIDNWIETFIPTAEESVGEHETSQAEK